MPFAFVPLLLLIIPVVEIAAFIVIGDQIGIGLTLLMILVTAIIGTILLRIQGLSLINKIQSEVANGRVPGKALGEGAMLLLAGILLLTPGFVTDSIGFLLFIPFIRNTIWYFLASRLTVVVPGMTGMAGGPNEDIYSGPVGDGPIIDLEEEEYHSTTPNPDSPWTKK